MLQIKNLQVRAGDKLILDKINLDINTGQTQAILGPNGSGKSTLAKVLSGDPDYQVVQGQINFLGQDLLKMSTFERARAGIFLVFQDPVEIQGLSIASLLRSALGQKRKHLGLDQLADSDFLKLLKQKCSQLGLPSDFYTKNVNENMSGGEKKMCELLQLAVLEPRLVIIDEIDSGLDVDNFFKMVQGLQSLKKKDQSYLIISHYQKFLEYLNPEIINILLQGKIVKKGGFELSQEIQKTGFTNLVTTNSQD